MSGPGTQVLPDLGQFGREIVVILADSVEIRTPAEAGLGVVDRLLDLLVRGTEEPGRLGVEEGAVPALGLRVQSDSHQLLYLLGISVSPSSIRLKISHSGSRRASGMREKKCGTRPRVSLMSASTSALLIAIATSLGRGQPGGCPGLWGVHSPRSWIGSTNAVRPGQHWPSPSQEYAR